MQYGFIFNGSHSNSFGVVAKSKNRQVLPAANDVYLQIPSRDGSYLIAGELSDRIIELECGLDGVTLEDLRIKMRAIAAWLNTGARVQLIFDDEPDKYYLAKLNGSIDLSQKFVLGEFSLSFKCEPYAYALTPKIQTVIDGAITVTNAGTTPAYPKYTVIFTAAATEYKLTLGSNYVHVIRNFAIGDSLVIDCALNKITVNNGNTMANLDLGSRFFALPVGGSTVVRLPVGGAQVTVNYKERWL